MDIIRSTEADARTHIDQIPDLIYATGPASYGYQFGSRTVFDPLVRASWMVPHTLFGHDAAALALDGGELLGVELGFISPGFRERADALAQVWPTIGEYAELDARDQALLTGLGTRVHECSWLNPTIPSDTYYVFALSVVDEHRGEGVGAALLRHALDQARSNGASGLQLDVLSDNPAVDFYRAHGLEVLVESKAPIPFSNGVPIELRMGVRFESSSDENQEER
ncbi:MAG: GNAT family N-acetyltransferase [Actinomycetota bacterium]